MDSRAGPDRRRFLTRGVTGFGALLLGGCDRLSNNDTFKGLLDVAEDVNLHLQRLLLPADKLAPEFAEADISAHFKANGTENPTDATYQKLAKNGFANWHLEIGGLVEKPAKFTLAQLRAMPSRTQITRHDCVEGWSCIGKWKGVPLGTVLEHVVPKAQARYVVFHCADNMGGDGIDEPSGETASTNQSGAAGQKESKNDGGQTPPSKQDGSGASEQSNKYYESIDLTDAVHPQTILAYEMNDMVLPIPHGAPIRLRVERQLGYKMAKYIMRIELVESFANFGDGKGGYWEDQGYDWYAGI